MPARLYRTRIYIGAVAASENSCQSEIASAAPHSCGDPQTGQGLFLQFMMIGTTEQASSPEDYIIWKGAKLLWPVDMPDYIVDYTVMRR